MVFILGCTRPSLLRRLFSSCRVWWLLSSCGAGASHCRGFPRCRAQALGMQASGVDSWVRSSLVQQVNSCGAQA